MTEQPPGDTAEQNLPEGVQQPDEPAFAPDLAEPETVVEVDE